MKKIRLFIILGIISTLLCLGGCEKKGEGAIGKDIDYTVVSEEDIPPELKKSIDKNKINPFELSYTDGEFMYLAAGYGEQDSGGFSIQVVALCEKGEDILFSTNLLGPDESRIVSLKKTTPYIVVKTEKMDRKVVYE
ncbi:MAG: protease complex subunit PrcB family protein [Lachnoclostridium sp.]|jgi:hypothetical protein|nr:protease complex subunit PrcB family protein [Lachnoclostridium sp.]